MIFISYRRSISSECAAALCKGLTRHFGEAQIFFDTRDLELGGVWREDLLDVVRRSKIMLVVVGPGWSACADENGRRRLELPTDPVRLEAVIARDFGVRRIPILHDNALPLELESAPQGLNDLAALNWYRLPRDSEHGIRALAKALIVVEPNLQRGLSSSQVDAIRHGLVGAGAAVGVLKIVEALSPDPQSREPLNDPDFRQWIDRVGLVMRVDEQTIRLHHPPNGKVFEIPRHPLPYELPYLMKQIGLELWELDG